MDRISFAFTIFYRNVSVHCGMKASSGPEGHFSTDISVATDRDRTRRRCRTGTTWLVHRFVSASASMPWTWGALAFMYASRS